MKKKSLLFQIIGNRLTIKDEGERTIITWKRMSALELLMFFLLVMMGVWGMGNYFGMKEIMGLQIIPFNTKGLVIYWGIWLVMAVHLFFNRKTTLSITPHEFIFKKRSLLPIARKYNTKNISKIELKEAPDFHESDIGYSVEIYKFYIFFNDGRKLKIDSFNTEDSNGIKEALQKYLSHKL